MVSMNKLTSEDRARILHLLCEGQSIRAITRLTGASKNTVAKLLCDAGRACMAYHDANVRNVAAKRIQVDEIWSFIYAKQKNVSAAKAAPEGAGDVWTWTAIEAGTKLIVSYFVGGRDGECDTAHDPGHGGWRFGSPLGSVRYRRAGRSRRSKGRYEARPVQEVGRRNFKLTHYRRRISLDKLSERSPCRFAGESLYSLRAGTRRNYPELPYGRQHPMRCGSGAGGLPTFLNEH